MNKKQLEQGLNGLLNPTPQEQPTETPAKAKKVYKAVCYNLHPNDIENVCKIAKYEGKRVNEVVTDALHYYFENWEAIPQEKPNLL